MFSASEIVECQHFFRYAEIVEHLDNGGGHRAGAAHVVFYIFWRIVLAQVIVVNYLMYEPDISRPVVFGARLAQRDVECEVRKFFFDSAEIFFVENLVF